MSLLALIPMHIPVDMDRVVDILITCTKCSWSWITVERTVLNGSMIVLILVSFLCKFYAVSSLSHALQ